MVSVALLLLLIRVGVAVAVRLCEVVAMVKSFKKVEMLNEMKTHFTTETGHMEMSAFSLSTSRLDL